MTRKPTTVICRMFRLKWDLMGYVRCSWLYGIAYSNMFNVSDCAIGSRWIKELRYCLMN